MNTPEFLAKIQHAAAEPKTMSGATDAFIRMAEAAKDYSGSPDATTAPMAELVAEIRRASAISYKTLWAQRTTFKGIRALQLRAATPPVPAAIAAPAVESRAEILTRLKAQAATREKLSVPVHAGELPRPATVGRAPVRDSLTRAAFNALTAKDRMAFCKARGQLTD